MTARRRHVLQALLLMVATPAGAELPDAQPIAGAVALAPFFAALAEGEAGRRGRPVHVLQIGDSHSAADHIAGRLRERLQARFGAGGRGVLPPGKPFALYTPRQISLEHSSGWRIEGGGETGLSGWRATATAPGETIRMIAEPEAAFDRLVLCGAGGVVSVVADGEARQVEQGDTPACTTLAFPAPRRNLVLAVERGPVRLFSFATFRGSAGIVESSLGVIGAQLRDFAARSDAVLAGELAAYAPDLILLAFGTNEGFDPGFDAAGYQALVAGQIRRLKRLAPTTAILLLGPPDANRTRPGVGEAAAAGFGCVPLSEEETADYPRLVAARAPALARWYPPPNLTLAREAQRRAAAQEGVAFWDWQARMGGACSAHRLTAPDMAMMRADHIHFTRSGGDMIADLLWSDLSAALAAAVDGAKTLP